MRWLLGVTAAVWVVGANPLPTVEDAVSTTLKQLEVDVGNLFEEEANAVDNCCSQSTYENTVCVQRWGGERCTQSRGTPLHGWCWESVRDRSASVVAQGR